MKFTYEAIGVIKSSFNEKFGTPRQPHLNPDSRGEIHLNPRLNPEQSLKGLEEFSHLWVLFHFHLNRSSGFKASIHPPRLNGKKTGVFSTRSPHRANPIGLSVVKIERIENGIIYVSSLDLVDGTPIIDIKPYIPSADRVDHAEGAWTDQIDDQQLQVNLSSFPEIPGNPSKEEAERLKALFTRTIELDPRALPYKGDRENPHPYGNRYAILVEDYNVVFQLEGTQAQIIEISQGYKKPQKN